MRASRVLDQLERLELFLYRKADLIVSVTRSFQDNLARRGIDPNKVEVVTNGVDVARFKSQPKDQELVRSLGLEGKFVAGYIGTHGMAHGLETVLETAAMAQQSPNGKDFRFILLGDGAQKARLVATATQMGLENVQFIDTVPKDEVVRYWSLLNVSIIHLKKNDLFKSVIPSKLFECMAMGIPVLHGVEGESAEIVRKEEVGLTIEPENPTALMEGLLKMHADTSLMGELRQNGPTAAHRYDRQVLASKMLEHLEHIVDERKTKKFRKKGS